MLINKGRKAGVSQTVKQKKGSIAASLNDERGM